MANFIIRKDNESKSLRFKPHYNFGTGQYHHTKDDYLKTLKQMNLVPYQKPKSQEEPEYKSSKWAHDMASTIQRGRVGSAFYAQLEKKGMSREKIMAMKRKAQSVKHLADKKDGGFDNAA